MRIWTPLVAALALTGTAAGPALAEPGAHLCSGIGEDAAAEAAAFPHRLKIVYAEKGGSYLGGIETVISADGKPVIEANCAGPWLLGDLAPGRYTITSTYQGATQTGQVTIGAGSGATERVIRF
ncbi:MAG: hypothetical protein AAF415_09630 [Pseudomonadota bacterium]